MSSSTDAARDIRIPHETVNDDLVTVQSWAVAHGARVSPGQVVVHIETSKAVLEIEAETAGYLRQLHGAGAQVAVGAIVGRIEAQPVAADAAAPPGVREGGGHTASDNGDLAISRKARALIDERSIDPAVFAGRGLVRERDVLDYLQQQEGASQESAPAAETSAPAPPPAAAAPQPEDAQRQPADASAYRRRGLLGDASASAGQRGRSLPWLIWNYFWRNWLLGNLVRVAPRGVINVLHRWRGVRMGRDCFIDPTATLETAYPENITMGDDVRVTVGAIIMTHIGPPHYLRDSGAMPATIRPVTLEDHCFIGVNAVIMPGVTVGRCAVVASGSVVVTNVSPGTMVSGNPAKVVRTLRLPGGAAE